MRLSTEVIVAIVSLVVAAPCTVVLLWSSFRKKTGEQNLYGESLASSFVGVIFLINIRQSSWSAKRFPSTLHYDE